MPTADEFRAELQAQIDRATKQRRPHIKVNAGELHRVVGGYPGQDHRMPVCCEVLREEYRKGNADLVHETDSGQGAALTVRFMLPR